MTKVGKTTLLPEKEMEQKKDEEKLTKVKLITEGMAHLKDEIWKDASRKEDYLIQLRKLLQMPVQMPAKDKKPPVCYPKLEGKGDEAPGYRDFHGKEKNAEHHTFSDKGKRVNTLQTPWASWHKSDQV